jgi:hypothetical protein
MRQFSPFFYGGGVGFVRTVVELALGSGVGLQAMFEAGRHKSYGRRLFVIVMANVIEIFFLCCLCALDNDVVP